jgi:UMF1 family MFS transporter
VGREGQLFGLYATTGRAVSFLAPALFGLFTYLFGSDRAGIVGILLVLGAGLLALLPVKSPPLSGPKAGAEPALQL